MKALTACLYCDKKKECPGSVKAHSFLDECFEAEDENIREALKDLGMLSKITLPVEVFEKTNSVAQLLVEQSAKMKKLCNYIAYGNCELVCVHANEYPCTSIIQCYECDEKCNCRDCKDFSKFEINWDKL